MTLEHYQLFTKPYGQIFVVVEHAGGIWRVKHGDEYIAEAVREKLIKDANTYKRQVERKARELEQMRAVVISNFFYNLQDAVKKNGK